MIIMDEKNKKETKHSILNANFNHLNSERFFWLLILHSWLWTYKGLQSQRRMQKEWTVVYIQSVCNVEIRPDLWIHSFQKMINDQNISLDSCYWQCESEIVLYVICLPGKASIKPATGAANDWGNVNAMCHTA
jgi:hypothetical protein